MASPRLRRFAYSAMAVLLLVAITPGVAELLEDTVHYALHGHTFHEADHPADHCCSGAFHFCSCHSLSFGAPVRVAVPRVQPGGVAGELVARGAAGGPADAHERGLLRPPAA